MSKLHRKPSVWVVIVIAIVFILVFAAGVFVINRFLYPKLLESWQVILFSLTGSFVASLAILSGFAQLTGYSIKDFLASREFEQDKTSEKRQKSETRSDMIEKMTEDIQSSLYIESEKLPSLLTKCLVLCDLAQLPQGEKDWLDRELNGYTDLITEEDGETKYLQGEVDGLASHRVLQPYFKIHYTSSETGVPELMSLPVPKVFIPYPISDIVETIQTAKHNNIQEISHILIKFNRNAYIEVQKFVAEHLSGAQMPHDLRAFIKISDYEGILNGTRRRVLQIVSEAKKKVLDV